MKILFILMCLPIFLFSSDERYLIILRHGQAKNNIEGTYNSDPNHPRYKPSHLTRLGKRQIWAAAAKLQENGFEDSNIVKVYTSPLPRGVETAEILEDEGIISKDKIVEDKRITEVRMGNREGMAIEYFKENNPWDHTHARGYNGETNLDIRRRVDNFYHEVVKKHPEGNLIIITHGTPALELIDIITNERPKLSTGEVFILKIDSSGKLVNDS